MQLGWLGEGWETDISTHQGPDIGQASLPGLYITPASFICFYILYASTFRLQHFWLETWSREYFINWFRESLLLIIHRDRPAFNWFIMLQLTVVPTLNLLKIFKCLLVMAKYLKTWNFWDLNLSIIGKVDCCCFWYLISFHTGLQYVRIWGCSPKTAALIKFMSTIKTH